MLIGILYVDNTYGMIKSKRLEEFIVSGKITKFFRSSGWVTIGVDPIRKANRDHLKESPEMATHKTRDYDDCSSPRLVPFSYSL
jgi:hypothetical protein